MSQDQLQIFHAAFKPRLKSPRSTRERELDKMLYRENQNLDAARFRIDKMARDERANEEASMGLTLLDKIRAEEEVKTLNCKKQSKRGCNNKSTKCITHNLWDQLDQHINGFFEKVKLQDLVRSNLN